MKTYFVETAGVVDGKVQIVAEKYSGLVGLRAATKFAKETLKVPGATIARIYEHHAARVAKRSVVAAFTAAEQVKAAGLKSLAELAAMVRKPPQTLRNWHRYSPELFATVIAGAVVLRATLKQETNLLISLNNPGARLTSAYEEECKSDPQALAYLTAMADGRAEEVPEDRVSPSPTETIKYRIAMEPWMEGDY